MSFSRNTTRRTTIEVTGTHGLPITLAVDYDSSRLFRVTGLEEELVQSSERPADYQVTFSGPVQTAKGSDHATHKGTARYRTGRHGRQVSDLPQALQVLLLGAEALASVEMGPVA